MYTRSIRGSRPNNRGRKRPPAIAASRFINKAVATADETPFVPVHSFDDFGMSDKTVATLHHLGFTTPSPIQDQTIALGLAGNDVIGLANTGTGKTAAFLLPIIENLIKNPQPISALVLAPTRELAQQIDAEFKRFAAGQKLYSALVVGGMNINRQINAVRRGPHIVIGTPGRVKDLIDRRVLRLSTTTTFVLDEADRMCDMGFVRDIRSIEAELPSTRQTYCFSATMTSDVQTIVEEFMREPTTVSVVKNITNDHIEQDVIHARDQSHKFDLLLEQLALPGFERVIVFCETKYGAQRLADRLSKSGHPATAIHGNKSQSQRERALKDFKSGRVDVLVATDVAARGLDIPDVSHVINFDAPTQYDDYVHRIGRTGRAGKAGVALTFVTEAKTSSNARTNTRSTRPARSQRPNGQTQAHAPEVKRKPHRRLKGAALAEHRLTKLIDEVGI